MRLAPTTALSTERPPSAVSALPLSCASRRAERSTAECVTPCTWLGLGFGLGLGLGLGLWLGLGIGFGFGFGLVRDGVHQHGGVALGVGCELERQRARDLLALGRVEGHAEEELVAMNGGVGAREEQPERGLAHKLAIVLEDDEARRVPLALCTLDHSRLAILHHGDAGAAPLLRSLAQIDAHHIRGEVGRRFAGGCFAGAVAGALGLLRLFLFTIPHRLLELGTGCRLQEQPGAPDCDSDANPSHERPDLCWPAGTEAADQDL
jgi:hypothetical protein